MDSLNAFLLSKFASNERFGRDVTSLHRRFQILSIIYLNLAFSLLAVVYNSMTWLFLNSAYPYLMFAVCLPLSGLSLLCLNRKMFDTAAVFLLLEMHASNTIATNATNLPSGALYGAMIYPFFISFLSSKVWIHLFNTTLCLAEHCLNSYRVLQIFEMTMTDEQTRQIYALLIAGMLGIVFACVTSFMQKFIELTIWNVAQDSYLKSENLTKEVVQSMEAKDAFVSMLSHEIRNPLNSLKGSVDYLLEVVKESAYLQVLRNAKLSGEILLNLVSNVLDVAKLKSDKMEMVYMETNVIDTIKKAFLINSENLKGKELFAEAFIDEKIPALIWIDPSRLLQIIMNLMSNAIKFTPKGGKITVYASWCPLNDEANALLNPIVDITDENDSGAREDHLRHAFNTNTSVIQSDRNITSEPSMSEFDYQDQHKRIQYLTKVKYTGVNDLTQLTQFSSTSPDEPWALHRAYSSYPDQNLDKEKLKNNAASQTTETKMKGYLKIQVSDSGLGIAENELPKLFGMFEQASQGTRSAHGGTGLGLWICKQICHKMNGEITIYSKVNKGTSFVFYIPVNNEKIDTTVIGRVRVSGNDRIKALIVDDYSVNRYLHRLLLEQFGVQVILASNGKEAVEKYVAQGDDLDLILMDIQMPEMDGFEAAKLIREYEVEYKKRKIDIFFVTGEYFNEEEVMTGFRNRGGLNENIRCLRKPLDSEMMKRVISRFSVINLE